MCVAVLAREAHAAMLIAAVDEVEASWSSSAPSAAGDAPPGPQSPRED